MGFGAAEEGGDLLELAERLVAVARRAAGRSGCSCHRSRRGFAERGLGRCRSGEAGGFCGGGGGRGGVAPEVAGDIVEHVERGTEGRGGVAQAGVEGGLQAAEVPYCPDNAILITSLENLSIYFQLGGRRRHVKEEPEKNRIANYESSNDAYVIEDYGLGCLVENIEIED